MQGGRRSNCPSPRADGPERKIVEEAYAGDIIGVFDPGIFSIGDTLTTSSEEFAFEESPPSRRSISREFVRWIP